MNNKSDSATDCCSFALKTFLASHFCILPPAPEKVVLIDRYLRRRGGLFFTPKGGKVRKKEENSENCDSMSQL